MLEREWDDFDAERWRDHSEQQIRQIREVNAIATWNQGHHWNSSTMVVQAIRDRLVADRDDR